MPIITFWSNNEKAIGQTVSAALAATVMAVEHNYKILLISADFNNETIENCFGAQESNKAIIKSLINKPQMNLDSGINGLLKLADSNRISPELIHDYTKIVFKNRLEVLYSPTNIQEEKKITLIDQFKNIALNASRYYDYVIIDLKKGLQNNAQLEILELSDVIVLNIEQGLSSIQKMGKLEQINHFSNKIIWNICRSDKHSKYNAKNLTRNIIKKQAVYETYYSTLVLEASQEGNIAELILRFKTLRGEDENLLFLKKIEELNQGILLKQKETQMRM